jgi:hypothetical protein
MLSYDAWRSYNIEVKRRKRERKKEKFKTKIKIEENDPHSSASLLRRRALVAKPAPVQLQGNRNTTAHTTAAYVWYRKLRAPVIIIPVQKNLQYFAFCMRHSPLPRAADALASGQRRQS